MTLDVGTDHVFTAALRGEDCTIVGIGGEPQPLPVRRWRGRADTSDRVVLAHCTGSTIDLGCGPGRMAEHLAAQGTVVLGIDVAAEAVEQARARGVHALRRDVFGPLPGEGRWECALLADGNIGIGGDPVRLLQRVRLLVAPGGTVVADLAEPGCGLQVRMVHLTSGRSRSQHFPWAVLGADAVRPVAAAAGLELTGLHEYDGRWFAVLRRANAEPACLV